MVLMPEFRIFAGSPRDSRKDTNFSAPRKADARPGDLFEAMGSASLETRSLLANNLHNGTEPPQMAVLLPRSFCLVPFCAVGSPLHSMTSITTL